MTPKGGVVITKGAVVTPRGAVVTPSRGTRPCCDFSCAGTCFPQPVFSLLCVCVFGMADAQALPYALQVLDHTSQSEPETITNPVVTFGGLVSYCN